MAELSDRSIVVAGGGVAPKEPVPGTWVLDLHRGTWSEAAPLPHPRMAVCGARCGELLVLVGGLRPTFSTSPRVDGFHLSDRRWVELPPLPRSRAWARAAWFRGELHVIGGWHVEGPRQESAVADHHVLPISANGVAGEWRESTPLPAPAYAGGLVERHGELCWIGGAAKMGMPSSSPDDLYEMVATRGSYAFDPSSETWRTLPALPEPRRSFQALQGERGLQVMGGLDGQLRSYASGWMLDEDEMWREIPALPETRHHGSVVRGAKEAWLLGGNYTRLPPPSWQVDLGVWPQG